MRRLPRSLDDIHGLRAARWIRESTAGQFDRYGPDSQREQQDRAIERHDLVDVGLEWSLSHSGRTVHASREMAELVAAAAAGTFDVLVVGYTDRWQRNLRWTLQLLEDDLHPAGVAVLFADRRILSSDPGDWDELVAEATAAERYSRRLAERITDGYAAKFRSLADQAGNAPMGFRRRTEPPHVLEVDPESIDRAVDVFERYAGGNRSMRELAVETGIEFERIVKMLRNPLYNGWVRRHRGVDEQRQPAPWRHAPPVDDELWRRCADLRAARVRGGGPSHRRATDLLRGLLHCAGCGRRLRANGLMGEGRSQRRQILHPDPCDAWGKPASRPMTAWSPFIERQLAGLEVSDGVLERIRAVLAAPAAMPIDTTAARIERRMRELAADHLAERVGDAGYLEQLAALRAEQRAAQSPRPPTVDAESAIERIRAMGASWPRLTEAERADVAHLIYARVDVLGSRIVGVELTPAAYAIALDQALPEFVRLEWRPRQGPGPQAQTGRVPIYGRRDRLRRAKTA
jgi:DNA invertase Pin-like site-specific DNA recombinase